MLELVIPRQKWHLRPVELLGFQFQRKPFLALIVSFGRKGGVERRQDVVAQRQNNLGLAF
jgi:hypothetical protein